MNVLSLFDGMSCGRIALERADIKVTNYFASEIDKHAIKVAMHNYPDTQKLGDVTKWREWNLPKIDLLLGGSPCQDLSGLKTGRGLDGEKSKLLFEFVSLKNKLQPTWFLLENVVPRRYEWKTEIDKLMGIQGVQINSDLFVQQNRPRIYWTNIPVGLLPKRPNWVGRFYQYRRSYFRKNMNGVCPCLTANMGTGGHNVPLWSENLSDRLSPEECEALQSVPLHYTACVSDSQRYKMLGNGWTVDVVAHIFSGLPVADQGVLFGKVA